MSDASAPLDPEPIDGAVSADADGTVARRGRGRPRDDGADARILSAAARLMLERGVPEITVAEVAERADVGKATVYRRFPSKADLAVRALESLFGAHIAVPDTGSLRTDLEQVYRDTIDFAGSARGSAFLRLAAGSAARSGTAAAAYRQAYESRRDRFGVILDRAVERGEIARVPDRALFLDALPALLLFRTVTRQPLPTIESVPDLVAGMLTTVVARPAEGP